MANASMDDVTVPNLEGLLDHDLAEHEAVFFLLANFCAKTRRARFSRKTGAIVTALQLEAEADKSYRMLPENLRW